MSHALLYLDSSGRYQSTVCSLQSYPGTASMSYCGSCPRMVLITVDLVLELAEVEGRLDWYPCNRNDSRQYIDNSE